MTQPSRVTIIVSKDESLGSLKGRLEVYEEGHEDGPDREDDAGDLAILDYSRQQHGVRPAGLAVPCLVCFGLVARPRLPRCG